MEITTKVGCSNFCSYCPQKKLITSYSKLSNVFLMSFDTFKTCIDKIPLDEGIWFCGMCEPFLNPECTKMILYAYQRGHKVSVFTTLVGLSLSDVDLLERISFHEFKVHLPSAEGLEKIIVDEKYLKILEMILEGNICAYFLTHAENVNSKVLPLLKKRNIEIHRAGLNTRAGNIENFPKPRKKMGIIRCVRNLHSNILLPNGDVILCCMDFGLQHILGNLLYSDYNSLYGGKEFLKIQRGLWYIFSDILCRHCDGFAVQYLHNLKKRIASIILINKLRN